MESIADVGVRENGTRVERLSRAGPVTRALVLRRGILLITAAAAATGVFAGLGRLGVSFAWGPNYASAHGPLLVLGTFGTVIALERAVALARPWAFAAPSLAAVTAFGLLVGGRWAPWSASAAALALIAVNGVILRRLPAPITGLMLFGAILLLAGDVVWALGHPVFQAVPAWVGFFVLTIVAERLELSRLVPTPRWASIVLVTLGSLLAFTSAACVFDVAFVPRALGLTLAAIAVWQLRFDLARHTMRRPGLPRFAAVGVLVGAVWLLVAGGLLVQSALPEAGPIYDALLHGIFVGYVLSMVFAHAPIVLPSVVRVHVPFSPILYLPLAILHLGLVSRVVGDLLGHAPLRRAGGIGNAIALATFILTLVLACLLDKRSRVKTHDARAA